MSRTIRRKTMKPETRKSSVCPYAYVGRTHLRSDYTDKEYRKALACFHSDAKTWTHHRPGPWFRNNEERHHRMDAKGQLIRFKNNVDYEVQILSKPRLPWWD